MICKVFYPGCRLLVATGDFLYPCQAISEDMEVTHGKKGNHIAGIRYSGYSSHHRWQNLHRPDPFQQHQQRNSTG